MRNLRLQNQCHLPRQIATVITRYTPANSCRTSASVTAIIRFASSVRLNLNLGLEWGHLILVDPLRLGITDYSSHYFCSLPSRSPPRTLPHSPALSVWKVSPKSNFIHCPFLAQIL